MVGRSPPRFLPGEGSAMSRMLGDVGRRNNSMRCTRRWGTGKSWQPVVCRPAHRMEWEALDMHARFSGPERGRRVERDTMLTAIDMAEAELRRLGLGFTRVRALDGVACLDLPSDE